MIYKVPPSTFLKTILFHVVHPQDQYLLRVQGFIDVAILDEWQLGAHITS